MKILVFSDSHGKADGIKNAFEHHPDADIAVHLGDGIKDLSLCGNIPENTVIHTVNGNFEDMFARKERYLTFDAGKYRFLITHGHSFLGFSAYGDHYSSLMSICRKENADVIMHGHTHKRLERYIPSDGSDFERENGIYIFNPGSISQPRDQKPCSYGVIEIRENGILFSHADITRG